MLLFDFAIAVLDQYVMLSNIWDRNALEKQMKSLKSSMDAVIKNASLIPEKYKVDSNMWGAIVNYVFQGENIANNRYVENIGKKILYKEGRYDAKTKKLKPFIEK